MSSKEKKPKTTKGSKKDLHKETEKSLKSTKSLKSSKSIKSSKSLKSDKSGKTKSDKSKKSSKSRSKTPSKKDLSPTQEDAKNLNQNLTPNNLQTYNMKPYTPNILSRSMSGLSNQPEKCEGCFESDAICYCKECEKSLCALCEGQIHIIPAYRNHERIPLTEMNHLKKMCYHHNMPLKYYCESCEEPICHECQVVGPHNTKLHRISNVMDAFKNKYNTINNIIQNGLMRKYEALTHNISIIDAKINEVDEVAIGIEREINMNYNAMLSHLKSEKGKRIAVLNFESANIQKELVKIDEIINNVKDANEENDMIGFLLRYSQINETIENLMSKPVELTIDKDISKLPSEYQLQKSKIDNYAKMEKLIKIKDDIIWELLQNKNEKGSIPENDRYGTKSSYLLSGSTYGNKGSSSNGKEIIKKITEKVKRNRINLYQLFCEFDGGDGKEMINDKDIPVALAKIGIEINTKDVIDILRCIGMREGGKINIKDLSRGIALYSE